MSWDKKYFKSHKVWRLVNYATRVPHDCPNRAKRVNRTVTQGDIDKANTWADKGGNLKGVGPHGAISDTNVSQDFPPTQDAASQHSTEWKPTPAQVTAEANIVTAESPKVPGAFEALKGYIDSMIAETIKAGLPTIKPSVTQADIELMIDCAIKSLPAPVSVVVTRPNLPDHTIENAHAQLPELLHASNLGFNVLMVGPAGSGKTTAAMQVAESMGRPYFEKTMGPNTSEWDIMGYKSPDGVYVPGALREPYETGGVLFLDELDNSNASVLTTLNGALGNGHCQFPDKIVKRHPDFLCIAAGNTYGRGADRLYVGRQQLDAATLDRFWVVSWNYDAKAELVWAGLDQREWVEYVQECRMAAETQKMRVVISPRASIHGAIALRAGISRETVEASRLWAGISADDKARIKARIA
jgi:cobaltochelatase CobS